MGFLSRNKLEEKSMPLILYVHEYGNEQFNHLDLSTAILPFNQTAKEIYQKESVRFNQLDYLIMTFWGNNQIKMIDVFGFGEVSGKWPGNPEVYAWVYQNGIYMPTPNITCSESLQMLGKEVEHRRKSSNLEEYLKCRPNLGDLQPKYEI